MSLSRIDDLVQANMITSERVKALTSEELEILQKKKIFTLLQKKIITVDNVLQLNDTERARLVQYDIYHSLLEQTCSFQQSANGTLLNPQETSHSQETSFWNGLVRHNAQCKKELEEGGINTELAFGYSTSKEITYTEITGTDPDTGETISKNRTFHVQQWDKNDINTLSLGNDFGCCIATDNNHFDAILERRMDSACFMHVVIDDKTNKPVCGNWLFFAKDSGTDKIFVVANFFEISENCGRQPKLNNFLVRSLFEFTTRYAKVVGAEGFLVRPLLYGRIKDFAGEAAPMADCVENRRVDEMHIEKVGGYYDIKTRTSVNDCIYYLVATECSSFYQAKPWPLETVATPLPLGSVAQQGLFGQSIQSSVNDPAIAQQAKDFKRNPS